MKHLFYFLLSCVLSIIAFPGNAQSNQQTFLRLSDPNGQIIRGTGTQRFFEGQIIATAFSGITTGNPQVQFTMPASSASAAIANLQGGKQGLLTGTFSIVQSADPRPDLVYTVRLEGISVERVQEGEGGTNVTLQASRIGTTYFQSDRKNGTRPVSGKTGYDFNTKSSWNNF